MKDYEKRLLLDRYYRLLNSSKNIKCPGVLRKLKRQIRNAYK